MPKTKVGLDRRAGKDRRGASLERRVADRRISDAAVFDAWLDQGRMDRRSGLDRRAGLERRRLPDRRDPTS